MTDNVRDAARLIAEHQIDLTWSRWLSGEEGVGDETIRCLCDCGEELDLNDHGAHVVAVIRDSGLTVIALPEPTSSDDTGTEWLDGEVFVGSPGNGRVRCYLEDARLNDDDAADLGAALIAASLTAQGDNP